MDPAHPAPFGRMLTAMVTPFTTTGGLDLDAAARLAQHLVDAGNEGLVVLGTTGESPTVSDGEAGDLIRAVRDTVGDRATVVAGVGTNHTAHSLHLAEQAAKSGAHGLLVVSPYYSKPGQAGLVAHVRAVADATDLPVMLYDIPGRTGVAFSADTLRTLAEHERVIAVKEASGDLWKAAQVMRDTDLVYYSGDDSLNLTWLALGAAGLVSVVGHVAAGSYVRMIEAVGTGDLSTARQIHADLVPVVDAVMHSLPGVVTAKAGLELLGVLTNRQVRLPLVAATDDEVASLRSALGAAGLLG